MSKELLASKVVVFEEEPHVRGIQSAPTSVAGAVGVTKRGPVNQAVLCTSFDEYKATFGDFTATSDLALAAKGFFENGGSQLWVSRVVSPTAVAATGALGNLLDPGPLPATVVGSSAPFELNNGESVRLIVDAATGHGYIRTLTFSGTPASVESSPAPFALTNGSTLLVSIDNAAFETVTFTSGQFANIGAATAAEVVNAINAVLVDGHAVVSGAGFRIDTYWQGTDARLLIGTTTAGNVMGLSGASSAGGGTVGGFGDVEIQDVVNILNAQGGGVGVTTQMVNGQPRIALQSMTLGPTSTIQAIGSALSLDSGLKVGSATGISQDLVQVAAINPGAEGNRIRVTVKNGGTNGPGEFDLLVELPGEDGAADVVELFTNVTRVTSAGRFIETVVNDPVTGSKLVQVTNVSTPDAPDAIPDLVTTTLTGGDDAIGGIGDADFIGDEASGTGLHAFDDVPEITLLLVPGQATPAVHNAMLTYCEVDRDGLAFAILDPPPFSTADGMVTYVSSTASLQNLSEHGAIYWPRVKVLNPNKGVFGSASQIIVAPSGILAGMYARTDGATPGGVYVSPAGTEVGRLFGVLGFETDEVLSEAKRDLVYPARINPLTTRPGSPKFADGSRTLKGDGSFPFIAERRGVSFIEASLKEGLQLARHKNNTPELRAEVRRTVTAFLLTQMNNGAFASRDAATAFFVDASDQINTASVIASGKLLVRIGLATNKPAEFIVLQISQDTRALEAELAAAE